MNLVVALGLLATGAEAFTRATPNPVDSDQIYDVTFSDFARPSKSLCSSSPLGTKSCYRDPDDGAFYRYGCKIGDNKVLTDRCTGSCDDANCENDWSWEGDLSGVCYDDGNLYFAFSCKTPGAPNTPARPMVPDDEAAPVPVSPTEDPNDAKDGRLTCAELGWNTVNGSPDVCGYSKVDNGKCADKVDYFTAEGMCKSIGARLCTSAELLDDESKSTGCSLDCKDTWTASECGADSANTQAGARKCIKDLPVTCTPKTHRANVRCCSDTVLAPSVDRKSAAAPQDYPAGWKKALSIEYDHADGNCGVAAPTAKTACWQDPVTGTALRFACDPAGDQVWSQTCQKDASCDPDSCTGDWFTDKESVGSCYEADQGSKQVFYQYQCL